MSFVGRYAQNPRFSPDTLPGLALWLDAADRGSFVLSGSNVTQWLDKSGSGNHASGGVSPTFSNAGIVFNGTTTYLSTPYTSFPAVETVVIVATATPPSNAHNCMLGAGVTGGRSYSVLRYPGGVEVRWDKYAVNSYSPTVVAVNTRFLTTGVFTGSGGTTSVNGGAQAGTDSFSFSGTGGTNIGATFENGYFNGTINEILVYNAVLSTAQRQQVEGYLAQKWDLAPSPLSIPGCVFWLDAGDRSTLTLSSSNTVTAWTEKSGANRTVTTNSTGVYSATAMNGRPGIQFSAGNVMTSSTASTLGNNLTAFVVFMATSEGPRQLNVPIFVGSSANGYWLTYRGDFQIYAARQEGGAQAGNSYYRNINIPIIMAGVASATLSQQTAFLNGYSTDVVNAAPLSNVGGTTIYIPGGEPYWGGPANGMFNGVISEVLLFSNALTTTQRQTVEGYLSSKWGISVNVKPPFLPSTHAFPLASPALRGFSPLDIDGLAIWLDAADSASYRLSGSNVTQFNDKQGLITLTASSAYATVGTQPGFTFASNTSTYTATTTITPAAFTTSSTDFTLAIIANHTTEGIVNALPFNIGISGPRLCPFFSYDGVPGRVSTFADCAAPADPRLGAGNSIVSGTPSVVIYRRSGPTVTLRIAGATAASNTFSSPSSFASSNYTVTMSPGGAKWWGTLYEVLHYSAALSDVDVVRLEGYLTDKWGLRASMGGVSHPNRFGPPMILPTHISGCRMWLDAADTTTLTLSGSNVSEWRDKSGVGIHHIQTTASNQPTYGTDSVYGRPGILFNGTSTFLTQSNTSLFPISNTNTYSIFTAHRVNSNSANIHTIYRGVTPIARQWFRWQSTFANFLADRDPEGYISFASNNVGAMNGTSSFVNDTGTSSGYINGTLIATASKTSSAISQYLSVGGVAGESMNGSIFEVIVFNRVVTAAERQQIEGYLAWKWGLQSNLPSPTTPWLQLKRALTPVFTPTQISGCTLWLDAADATTVTLSGSNVTAWRDKSGRTTLSLTGTPPTYVSNQVRFNSSGRFMGAYAMTTQTTFFAVYSTTNTTTNARLISVDGNYYGNVHAPIPTADLFVFDGGAGGYYTTLAPQAGLRMYTVEFNGVNSLIWRNGSAATLGGARAAGPATGSNISIGADLNGTVPFIGELSELILFSAALTTSQRQRVEGYLAWKWGIQANLPTSTHPYRTFKP